MFFRRASFFACCLDKHLYVIGGRNETGYLSSVEAYNLETNEWNYVSSLPQPLAAHAGAVHNGKIYISGESVERYCRVRFPSKIFLHLKQVESERNVRFVDKLRR